MEKKPPKSGAKPGGTRRRTEAPPKHHKPTVNDLVQLAKREFLACRRVDVQQLATELGVARATAFRWVGDRETLYGHVCASLFTATFDMHDRQLAGKGLERDLELLRRVFNQVSTHPSVTHFIANDAAFAMRVVSAADGPSFRRATALIQSLLERSSSELAPVLSPTVLASTVMILGNAFMFGHAFGGRHSDVASLMTIIHAVLTAGHA